MSDVFCPVSPKERLALEEKCMARLKDTLGDSLELIDQALNWVAFINEEDDEEPVDPDRVDMTRVELLYGLAASVIVDAEMNDRKVLEKVCERLHERGISLDELVREAADEPANQ